MENNQWGSSDQENQEGQRSQGGYGHNSGQESDRNPDDSSAKFQQDNDDFSRAEDDMDGEAGISSNAGFTGSSTSSTRYTGENSDYTDDSDMDMGDSDMDMSQRNDGSTNEDGQSYLTNYDDESEDIDWD